MALLGTESFDNGNTSTMYVSVGSAATINSTGGIYNTGCAYIANSHTTSVNVFRKLFRPPSDATSNASINFSFWFKAAAPPTSVYRTIYAEDSKNNIWGTGFGFNTDGRITAFDHRNSLAGNIYDYSVLPSVCDGEWHFLEYNTLAINSVSAYTNIWQDGKLAIYYAGNLLGTTQATRYDLIGFYNLVGTNGCRYWIDDVTIWDQVGTAYSGYPKGPTRIQTLRPISDISSVNTTSTGATNYGVVDEANGFDTTDYITLANTANAVFEVSNVVDGTANVYGIITYAHINGGQGGFSNVRIGNKLGTTFSYTTAQTFYSQSYTTIQYTVENNFVNGGALTTQNVNDLIISVDRIP